MNQRMLIPRVSQDETTFAVVEFAGVPRQELKTAVQRSVTEWVKNSEEGRLAFSDSDDFNVGDLANELTGCGGPLVHKTDPLPSALIKHGLTYLSIDTYSDDQPTGWEFDDRLVLDDLLLDDGITGKKP